MLLAALVACAACPAAVQAREPIQWKRLAGDDAAGTMWQVVEEGWGGSGADAVVLATADGYHDSLAAASLAGSLDAPVIITDSGALSAPAAQVLDELRPSKVYICGGTMSVSEGVESEVRGFGATVERIAGGNAAQTAVDIAKKVAGKSGTCIVASGSGYWDALSASPYAYSKMSPIFLTSDGGRSIDAETLAAIRDGGYTRALVVGGTMSVSEAAEAQVRGVCGEVVRIAGETAYDTSERFAGVSIAEGMVADGFGLATCGGYWDALTGGALCGRNGSVLLLADRGNTAAVTNLLGGFEGPVSRGYLFGGTMSLSSAVPNYLDEVLFSAQPSGRTWDEFLGAPLGDDYAEWRRQWIIDNLDNSVQGIERVWRVVRFVGGFPYDTTVRHYTARNLYLYGDGTCYSSAEMVKDFMDDLGIPCENRFAGNDGSYWVKGGPYALTGTYTAMSDHRNNFVWVDGEQWLADATPGNGGWLYRWSDVSW